MLPGAADPLATRWHYVCGREEAPAALDNARQESIVFLEGVVGVGDGTELIFQHLPCFDTVEDLKEDSAEEDLPRVLVALVEHRLPFRGEVPEGIVDLCGPRRREAGEDNRGPASCAVGEPLFEKAKIRLTRVVAPLWKVVTRAHPPLPRPVVPASTPRPAVLRWRPSRPVGVSPAPARAPRTRRAVASTVRLNPLSAAGSAGLRGTLRPARLLPSLEARARSWRPGHLGPRPRRYRKPPWTTRTGPGSLSVLPRGPVISANR